MGGKVNRVFAVDRPGPPTLAGFLFARPPGGGMGGRAAAEIDVPATDTGRISVANHALDVSTMPTI